MSRTFEGPPEATSLVLSDGLHRGNVSEIKKQTLCAAMEMLEHSNHINQNFNCLFFFGVPQEG